MLTNQIFKTIGKGGLRLAAALAGLQLPVGIAKVAVHAATVGHVDCLGQSAVNTSLSLSQTVFSTLDACVISQLVHAVGLVIASDSIIHWLHAVANIVGNELFAQLVTFALQILS